MVAENDGGKRITATLNADLILRMRTELCDLCLLYTSDAADE